MARKPIPGRKALSATLLSAVAVLVLAAIPVQITGTGIDLYALLWAGVLLLLLERTVGDWIADMLGPAGTALVFALIAAGGVAYLLSDAGRARAQRFMVIAEAHGYRAAYFKAEPARDRADKNNLAADVQRVADSASPDSMSPHTAVPPAGPAAGPSADPGRPVSPAAGANAAPGWSGLSLGRPVESATARVYLTPDLATIGDRVAVRFAVLGTPRTMPATVTFSVNGTMIARVPVRADGSAEAEWRPDLPGSYRIHAETAASSLATTSFGATLHVLPRSR